MTCPKCRASWLWSPEATVSERFEVRPRARRNSIIVSIRCALFTPLRSESVDGIDHFRREHSGGNNESSAQRRSLKSFGKVGTLAESMTWSRDNFGFDLGFAWSDLDRSPEAVVLEHYRKEGEV